MKEVRRSGYGLEAADCWPLRPVRRQASGAVTRSTATPERTDGLSRPDRPAGWGLPPAAYVVKKRSRDLSGSGSASDPRISPRLRGAGISTSGRCGQVAVASSGPVPQPLLIRCGAEAPPLEYTLECPRLQLHVATGIPGKIACGRRSKGPRIAERGFTVAQVLHCGHESPDHTTRASQ
jgi:hypothetical protein